MISKWFTVPIVWDKLYSHSSCWSVSYNRLHTVQRFFGWLISASESLSDLRWILQLTCSRCNTRHWHNTLEACGGAFNLTPQREVDSVCKTRRRIGVKEPSYRIRGLRSPSPLEVTVQKAWSLQRHSYVSNITARSLFPATDDEWHVR